MLVYIQVLDLLYRYHLFGYKILECSFLIQNLVFWNLLSYLQVSDMVFRITLLLWKTVSMELSHPQDMQNSIVYKHQRTILNIQKFKMIQLSSLTLIVHVCLYLKQNIIPLHQDSSLSKQQKSVVQMFIWSTFRSLSISLQIPILLLPNHLAVSRKICFFIIFSIMRAPSGTMAEWSIARACKALQSSVRIWLVPPSLWYI